MTHDTSGTGKHPDSPGEESVDEALNEPTRQSMASLGRADIGDAPDARTGDSGSTPRPSQAEGGDEGTVDRPPRPSQAEGDRETE